MRIGAASGAAPFVRGLYIANGLVERFLTRAVLELPGAFDGVSEVEEHEERFVFGESERRRRSSSF